VRGTPPSMVPSNGHAVSSTAQMCGRRFP
jgi:hypothetical protein